MLGLEPPKLTCNGVVQRDDMVPADRSPASANSASHADSLTGPSDGASMAISVQRPGTSKHAQMMPAILSQRGVQAERRSVALTVVTVSHRYALAQAVRREGAYLADLIGMPAFETETRATQVRRRIATAERKLVVGLP